MTAREFMRLRARKVVVDLLYAMYVLSWMAAVGAARAEPAEEEDDGDLFARWRGEGSA